MQPLAVFDLDGTLVDTAPDLVDTLNVILAREGLPPVPFADARVMIGGGARVLLERGLAARAGPASVEEVDRLFAQFLDHYAAHISERSRPFPGVVAALDTLQARGFTLAVCTNKLEWLSKKLLAELKLTERFALICGQDTFGVRKPDPVVWRRTIEACAADPARAIMIGDSATDIDFARAAGAPVIAVDFGYTEVPVTKLNPDRVIGHFDALVPAIEDVLARRAQGALKGSSR